MDEKRTIMSQEADADCSLSLLSLPKKRTIGEPALKDGVYELEVSAIIPNRRQPRKQFGEGAIRRLADSIQEYGVMQPVTVRKMLIPLENGKYSVKYELISGERRLRACKMANIPVIPAIIVNTDEQTSAELALIENLLREDLNCFEQAEAFERLMKEFHLNQEEVGRRVSMSQSAVANKLRLLGIEPELRAYICEHELSERHARTILRISDRETRKTALHAVTAGRLTVAETEKMVDSLLRQIYVEPIVQQEPNKKQRERQKIKVSVKNVKLFLNSIDNAVKIAEKVGIHTEMEREESEEKIVLKITVHTKCFT